MVLQMRPAMRSEGDPNEICRDIARPFINPATLEAHAGDGTVNRVMQRRVDSVGTKRNACHRPPRERGVGQQSCYCGQVYDRTAHEQEQSRPSTSANVTNHNLLSFLFICNHARFLGAAGLTTPTGRPSAADPLPKTTVGL